MSLRDKVALVTGGTGALGSVIAERLQREGAQVWVSYVVEKELHALPAGFTKSVHALKADVTNEQEVVQLYHSVVASAKRVDIVVNTVGAFLPAKPVQDVSESEWDFMMNVNLKSAFLSTREALKRMDQQSYGRVVNISAKVGLEPTAGRVPYAISKAGVAMLTALAAAEVKGTGVTVNAVAPSIILTDANRASMPDADHEAWVKPEEIASLVVYLCSDDARSVSGTTFKAYGGV